MPKHITAVKCCLAPESFRIRRNYVNPSWSITVVKKCTWLQRWLCCFVVYLLAYPVSESADSHSCFGREFNARCPSWSLSRLGTGTGGPGFGAPWGYIVSVKGHFYGQKPGNRTLRHPAGADGVIIAKWPHQTLDFLKMCKNTGSSRSSIVVGFVFLSTSSSRPRFLKSQIWNKRKMFSKILPTKEVLGKELEPRWWNTCRSKNVRMSVLRFYHFAIWEGTES